MKKKPGPPRWVLIDELHLAIAIPSDWSEARHENARRALLDEWFLRRVELAVKAALKRYPALRGVRFTLAR